MTILQDLQLVNRKQYSGNLYGV